MNKVVVITGASSGIGRSLCFELAKHYQHLFICGRSEQKLKELASELISEKVKVEVVPLDLLSDLSVEKAAYQIISNCRQVDLLVNNAGLSQRSLAADTDGEVEKMLFQINYFAPVLLTKLLIGRLRNSNNGKIVITSSIAGKFGYYLRSTYSATKHALHGFFESLRMEEKANGISVLFMTIGRAQTNISVNAMTQNGKKYGKMDQGQEGGLSPEKVAAQMMNAIRNNKRETLIGGKEIYMVYFKKLFPWLFYRIANKKIKTEGGV